MLLQTEKERNESELTKQKPNVVFLLKLKLIEE